MFWQKSKPFEAALLPDGAHDHAQYQSLGALPSVPSDGDADFTHAQRLVEEDQLLPAVSLDDYFASSATDDKENFKRPERARAKKAGQWIGNPAKFITDIAITLIGIEGTEHLLYLLMSEQRRATWSGQYGVDALPLVRSATLPKSPAIAVLTQYHRMMAQSSSEVLFVLQGVPGVDMSAAADMMHQILVKIQGHLWRRQVHTYTMAPWSTLRLLHSETSQQERVQIVDRLLKSPKCLIDEGFTGTVVKLAGAQAPKDVACQSSDFMCQLFLLACSKTTNAEVETNFARATAARSYMHGKVHNSSTMASKHCVAELAHLHHVQRQQEACAQEQSESKAPIKVPACKMPLTDLLRQQHLALGDAADGSEASERAGATLCWRTNSWILFRTRRFKTRPALLGESAEERHRRITAEARDDFKKPEFASEIAALKQEAKRLNRDGKALKKAQAEAGAQAPAQAASSSVSQPLQLASVSAFGRQQAAADCALESVVTSSSASKKCLGPWGVSDRQQPLSHALVEEAQKQKGFVKTYGRKWVSESCGKPVDCSSSNAPRLRQHVGDTTFCMKLGGCYHELPEVEQNNVLQALEHLKNVLRCLQKNGGRRGKAPLLLLAAPCENSAHAANVADPQAFLLLNLQFKPFDVTCWRCKIIPDLTSARCPGIACPSSFCAEMQYLQLSPDAFCPDFLTMHQVAFAHRASNIQKDWGTRLVLNYELDSQTFNKIHLQDVNFGAGLEIPAEFRLPQSAASALSADDKEFADAKEMLDVCKKGFLAQAFSQRRPRAKRLELSYDEPRQRKRARQASGPLPEQPQPSAPARAPAVVCEDKNTDQDTALRPQSSSSSSSSKPASSLQLQPLEPSTHASAPNASEPEHAATVDDGTLFLQEVSQSWQHCIDLEDPESRLLDVDVDVQQTTIQDESGYVYEVPDVDLPPERERPRPLGRITEFVNFKGRGEVRTFKVACFQHKDCVLFRRAAALPVNADVQARKWLLAGKKFGSRNQGSQHVRAAVPFLPR